MVSPPAAPTRRTLAQRAHGFAEAVSALLLAVIFVAFIIQVVFRYVFNFPGWTAELSVAAWLWLVLWGAAFVLKDADEIRFDILVSQVGRRARIAIAFMGTLAILVLFAMSLKASWSYVTFMAVEKSSYLKIRMDWMYSIYILFAVAIVVRHAWKLVNLLRGRDPADIDITKSSSAL
jgi:TRAP-type C4-dicarboxylate transport system permease small subunit